MYGGPCSLSSLFSSYKQVQPYPKHYVQGESREDSTIVKVLKCFSININGRAVLNTDAAGEGHLTCMNGMRYVMINFTKSINSNFLEYEKAKTKYILYALIHLQIHNYDMGSLGTFLHVWSCICFKSTNAHYYKKSW